jgi:endonuclease/exonuclease/phosphatase family metal-dependent hydrolase
MSVVEELPRVDTTRRAAMLELPVEPATHAALLAELDFLDVLEVRPPARASKPDGRELRVACWNMERGRHLEHAAELLRGTRADLLLLTELDVGMARTGQLHVARELASRLDCGYAYGIEFLELGLGNEHERPELAGLANEVGFHGGAILSPHALRDPLLVRLDRSGRWFDGAFGERRVGGRMAALAKLEVAGIEVVFASVHLESHGDPLQRADEFALLLDAIEAYAPGAPALIGGDVNTTSLGRRDVEDRAQLARLLRENPGRLLDPVPHEPLFARAEAAGYDWRSCNALDESTQRKPDGRGGLRLDWFFCRGLEARDPAVVDAVAPGSGLVLSDHELIRVRVRLPEG